MQNKNLTSIAEAAGVSISTVSKVLNRCGGVSSTVRQTGEAVDCRPVIFRAAAAGANSARMLSPLREFLYFPFS